MAGLITKCAAWKQLQHVLCLTELIDSNTTIDIWRIWEGIRGLTGVHEKQSGIAEKQEIAVAAIRRQSTWGKFTESQPSPPLFSTQSLEGIVWISETQRKYSWLFPHIHKYRHNPGNPATYTKKKKVKSREKSQQYNLSFFKHQGQDLQLQSLLRTGKPGYSSEQQDPAALCWWEISPVSLLHGDGRLCLIVLTAHLLFHKQLYFICCSSSLRLSVTGYLSGQVFSYNLHIRSYLHYNPYMYLIVLSQ